METKVKQLYLVLLLIPNETYAIFKVIFEGVKTLGMVKKKNWKVKHNFMLTFSMSECKIYDDIRELTKSPQRTRCRHIGVWV